jgi:hypothetical protein
MAEVTSAGAISKRAWPHQKKVRRWLFGRSATLRHARLSASRVGLVIDIPTLSRPPTIIVDIHYSQAAQLWVSLP